MAKAAETITDAAIWLLQNWKRPLIYKTATTCYWAFFFGQNAFAVLWKDLHLPVSLEAHINKCSLIWQHHTEIVGEQQ